MRLAVRRDSEKAVLAAARRANVKARERAFVDTNYN